MRRKLFNIAAIASLVLLIVLGVLWIRSYARGYVTSVSRCVWPSTDACIYRYLSARIVLGHFLVCYGRNDYDTSRPDGIHWHHAMDVTEFRSKYVAGLGWKNTVYDVQLGPQPSIVVNGRPLTMNFGLDSYLMQVQRWHGFGSKQVMPRTHLGQTMQERDWVAPVWPAGVALAVLPVAWIVQAARRKRRNRLGFCRTCGYDLRASPDRCPECGTSVQTAQERPATAAS